jgi:predicted naringenin-chalcone synthase
MSSMICGIGTSNPVNKFSQMEIFDFMRNAHELNDIDTRRLEKIYKSSGIDYRYSALTDFGLRQGDFPFFGNQAGLKPFPTTAQRGEIYKAQALELSLKAIADCTQTLQNFNLEHITHLITVSCTGMYAPGLDIELVESLKLKPSVERTCINFMGCYGAFNALKAADYICKAEPKATVLIVNVELCTLHFQVESNLDNWLSNALFGDGASAVIVQHQDFALEKLFEIKSFYTEIVSEAREEMAWEIGDFGYQMQLTNKVPKQIKKGIKTIAEKLLTKANLNWADVKHFAIHPGGRRILEVCAEVFNLNDTQNNAAYEVLRKYGNMSSATILFVLAELAKTLKSDKQPQHIMSFAFGPGLTFESMILQYARL